jgi:hypothetical protein
VPNLTILIIRHAEKPEDGPPEWGPGLRTKGQVDPAALVIRGWQRAGSWAALFGAGLGGPNYPQPQVIFAANPDTPPGGKKPSQRPFETIKPLADRLGMDPKPIKAFAKGQEEQLAHKLVSLGGVVLVSWEHEAIVEKLLPAIAGGRQLLGMPHTWERSRFDVVLRLDRAEPDAPWSFRQLFPRLLSGDSDTPLK